jgi:3-deoxy-D-arabino-heptulosonate 7-phosphate (DAHP) synthase class II
MNVIIKVMSACQLLELTIIVVRIGAEKLCENVPGLIRAVQRDEGKSVIWIFDLAHRKHARLTMDLKLVICASFVI